MTHAAPFDQDDRSPSALWDAARYALEWFVNLFGSPSEVAGFGVLAPRERGEMLGWLRSLEALVRALLVIAAAAVPASARPARSAKPSARRSRQEVEHDPDQPERWRVHFRAVPPRPGPASCRRAPGAVLPSAWPIAERLEAVIRVLDNPAPFAQRLARRLRGGGDRIARALRPPPAPPRNRTRVGEWAFKEARAQALIAAAAFDTS